MYFVFFLKPPKLSGLNEESINNVIKTIVKEYKWPMSEIKDLYLDDADPYGIMFWYNDIQSEVSKIKNKKIKK